MCIPEGGWRRSALTAEISRIVSGSVAAILVLMKIRRGFGCRPRLAAARDPALMNTFPAFLTASASGTFQAVK